MSLFKRRSPRNLLQPVRPKMESLESRAYFSLPALVITIPTVLPSAKIAGVTVNERIGVNIANDGPGSLKGPFTLTLFASTDQTVSVDSAELVDHTYPGGVSIAQGKNRTFNLVVKAYPVNLDADYFIVGQISQAGNTVVGASTSQIAITPKSIDLSDVVASAPTSGKIGHSIAVTVDVSNNGNVLAQGSLAVNFAASTSMTGTSPVNLATLSTHIHIEPGKTQVLHLRVPLPVGIPSGNQFIVADVDPANTFNETNLANNIAVSSSPVSLT